MAQFKYAYDLSGCSYAVTKEFPIAAATAIKKGAVVTLSAGKIVAGGTTPTTLLGIAAEAHDGATAGRQSGTVIKVYCSPTAVYKVLAPSITASSDGTTTTFISTDLGTIANDGLNGGYIKFKTVTNTALLQVVAEITDFATSTGTVTTGTLAAATKSADVIKVFPPVGSVGWKPVTDGNDINVNATGGVAIQIVDVDTDQEVIYFKIKTVLV